MLSEKALISTIASIKMAISDVIRDRLYSKNFSTKIIQLLYELDDYHHLIGVDIIQKTDLHKCLKPLLSYSDAYRDMKETCQNVLEKIMKNIKDELFVEKGFYANVVEEEWDSRALYEELQVEIEKSNEEDNDECLIQTDGKYLEGIKKSENNMLLETKRSLKVKRSEVVERIPVEEGMKATNDSKEKNKRQILKGATPTKKRKQKTHKREMARDSIPTFLKQKTQRKSVKHNNRHKLLKATE